MIEERPMILVVDDEAQNRDTLSQRVLTSGHDVVTAVDGGEALQRLRSMRIDLVVLQAAMTGLSGVDIVKWIRRGHQTLELPVLMTTPEGQTGAMLAALDAGANDCVTRPLDMAITLARIEALLRMKKDYRERTSRADAATSATDGSASVQVADGVHHVDQIRPGMVLGGTYKLGEKLGAGNCGTVFRAIHLGFDQGVAIKILHTSAESSPDDLKRFRQEGQAALRLQHANSVAVTDCSITPNGLAYLVMEMLEGRTLEAELRQQIPISHRRAASITLSICGALEEAHHLGILHRDIKPANIFLHQEGHQEVVKVLDFGTAKLVGEAAVQQNLTLNGQLIGTPAYMAPERFKGEACGGHTDAYSLGIVFYQMLAGRLPFLSRGNGAIGVAMMHITAEAEPLRRHCPNLSPELENMVMALLRKDPARRLGIRQLAHSLERYLGRKSFLPTQSVAANFDSSKFRPGSPRTEPATSPVQSSMKTVCLPNRQPA